MKGRVAVPTYDYRCPACNKCFEKFHSISYEEPVLCPDCKGQAVKLLSPSTIIYRGSGFYSTDYASPFSNMQNKPSAKKEAQDSKKTKKE